MKQTVRARTSAFALGPSRTVQTLFPANVSCLQNPQIPTFLMDLHQPLLCQDPTEHPQEPTGINTTIEFFFHYYLKPEEVTCPTVLIFKHFYFAMKHLTCSHFFKKVSIMLQMESWENTGELLLAFQR